MDEVGSARIRRPVHAAAAISILLLVIAPVQPVAAVTLTLAPASGLPGATVVATASGFGKGPVEFWWDNTTLLGKDPSGQPRKLTFQVPAGASVGAHLVRVCQGADCPSAPAADRDDATFTVTAPPTPTPTVKPTPQPPPPTPRPTPRATTAPGQPTPASTPSAGASEAPSPASSGDTSSGTAPSPSGAGAAGGAVQPSPSPTTEPSGAVTSDVDWATVGLTLGLTLLILLLFAEMLRRARGRRPALERAAASTGATRGVRVINLEVTHLPEPGPPEQPGDGQSAMDS